MLREMHDGEVSLILHKKRERSKIRKREEEGGWKKEEGEKMRKGK
jgi:hypothetical protein